MHQETTAARPETTAHTATTAHTETMTSAATDPTRTPVHKTVLMCRPEHFTVTSTINVWMDPSKPTRTDVALAQWQTLHDAYTRLGYDVELIDPIDGLDDMVYAANGGFTLDGKAYGAKFTYAERIPEGPAYMEWFGANGFEVHEPEHVNEGEGDMLLSAGAILAGHGFRTSLDSHDELRGIFDREVVSLRLVDPRFYHLDTAMAILDGDNIAYLPAAFDDAGRAELERRYPDAILVDEADASVLGLNSFGDGRTMVIAQRATGFERQLRSRGYETIGLDLSELLLGGGGIKCCTLELRR
ncbi:N-Dimethylarginine dimethylaminohydrolase [Agrococcus baldri]|uniref:N-Dimethylarginine dimethylaminohydrolase n=1 Tax=Agrococcus baldri TaxID=153730 RepID=A0AA94HMH2_9MICO|nr:N-Dimethylarginine dimethylaminohydrolase [Agrococcus baldri]